MSASGKTKLSGGFWRRAGAALLDVLVVMALVSLVGICLYAATDGRVRISQSIWRTGACEDGTTVAQNVTAPAGFRVDSAVVCRWETFGREIDRELVLTQWDVSKAKRVNGVSLSGFETSKYSVPLDKASKPTSAFYLDWMEGLFVVAFFAVLEASFGFTLGKAALGLKVASRVGGRPSLAAALLRNVLIWGGWAVIGVVAAFPSVMLTTSPFGGSWFWIFYGVTLAWMTIVVLTLIFSRPNPLFDVIAGTRVVTRGASQP